MKRKRNRYSRRASDMPTWDYLVGLGLGGPIQVIQGRSCLWLCRCGRVFSSYALAEECTARGHVEPDYRSNNLVIDS